MNFHPPHISRNLPPRRSGMRVLDIVDSQLEELAEIRNPALRDKVTQLAQKRAMLTKTLAKQAVHVFLPWRNTCIKTLPEPYFFELKTARNKNLISSAEQKAFYEKPVGVAGLSVGSNIARLCVLQGGAKYLNLADADTIGTTNLNRILAGIHTIGQPKTDALAEALYEMNPFAEFNLFPSGITEANVESFFYHHGKRIAVLIEEVDNMNAKIALRRVAAQLRVPVVSIADNADGAIVEVERYDRGFTFARFERRLKPLRKMNPATMTIQQKAIAITNYIGTPHIPNAMLKSVRAVGSSLFSWPQLGGAALLSGVLGAYCVRRITSGSTLASGTYRFQIPSIFNSKRDNAAERKKLLAYFS